MIFSRWKFKLGLLLSIGTFCVTSLLSTAAAAPEQAKGFDALITQARQAKDAGLFERAITILKQAYAIRPAPTLLNNIGKMYSKLGRYKEAVKSYQLVVDDPDAPQQVRALDEQRIAKLEPKLSKAWVRVDGEVPWSNIWVNGQFCPTEGAAEIPVSPGTRWLEYQHRGGHGITLGRQNFPMGRRTTISRTHLDRNKPTATLLLGQIAPRPVDIEVDGLKVQSAASRLQTIELPAGNYTLRLMKPDGRWIQLKTQLQPGQETNVKTILPATWSSSAAAISSGPNRTLIRTTQVAAIGLGATLVTSGLYLFHDVDESREYILDETQNPNMTMRDADARWRTLNNRATLGGILTGLGGALVVGVGAWWWLDRPNVVASPGVARTRVVAPWCQETGCGLEIGGAF